MDFPTKQLKNLVQQYHEYLSNINDDWSKNLTLLNLEDMLYGEGYSNFHIEHAKHFQKTGEILETPHEWKDTANHYKKEYTILLLKEKTKQKSIDALISKFKQ